MATKLGSLLIELGLDSAKFRSGLRRAERDMTTFQRTTAGAANLVKGALVGMVSALSVDMFAQAINNGLQYAASLGEVAQQLGVTTNTLQEYRYAATQVGLTQEEMENSLAKLTRSIGMAAEGGKAQAEAFARLGVSIRDSNGNIKEAGDLIPEIADGLKLLGSDAQRAAVLTELFGRAGQKLAPLLSGGSTEVNNLRDAAHSLGVVLSEEQIANADETADKLEAVKTVLQAQIAGVVANNSSAIIDLANSLGALTTKALEAAGAWMRYTQAQGNGLAGNFSTGARIVSPGALIAQMGMAWWNGGAQPSGDPFQRLLANSSNPEWMRSRRPTPAPQPVSIPLSGGGGRVGGGGESAAASAARETQRAAEEQRRALASLLDELNPVAAKQRELAENTELLNRALRAGQLTVQQHTQAVAQLRREYGAFGEGVTDWRDIVGDVAEGVDEDMRGVADVIEATYGNLADHWEAQAQRMAEAAERQKQALFDTLGSIRNFANSIKSGDILGIFESILGLLEGIGGITGGFRIGGVQFGTGQFSRIPGFANGTNSAPGGLAWVGERGRELVNLPRGSQVIPNHELSGLGTTVQVIPSPYFNVVVDGRIQTAAPAIASAGSQGAQVAMARRSTRRLA